MIWALYLMLGVNMWWDEYEKVDFDDDAWEKIVEEVKASGLNTIVLDLAEGVSETESIMADKVDNEASKVLDLTIDELHERLNELLNAIDSVGFDIIDGIQKREDHLESA